MTLRFMLIIHAPEDLWIPKDTIEKIVPWKEKLAADGVHLTGNPLKPAGMSHSVTRGQTGAVEVCEEPYRDDDITFFAFEIIQCDTIKAAVGVAAGHPVLLLDDVTIEVRQIWDTMGEDFLGRPTEHG